MRVIGLDIHRAFAEAVAWKDGKLSRLGRVIMRREPLEAFAKQLSADDVVVIEATGNAASVAAVIGPHVGRVVVCQSKTGPPHCPCQDQDRYDRRRRTGAALCQRLWIADEATQATAPAGDVAGAACATPCQSAAPDRARPSVRHYIRDLLTPTAAERPAQRAALREVSSLASTAHITTRRWQNAGHLLLLWADRRVPGHPASLRRGALPRQHPLSV